MNIATTQHRDENKLVRMCERIGKNTTPIAMTRKQWIKVNVMYANMIK